MTTISVKVPVMKLAEIFGQSDALERADEFLVSHMEPLSGDPSFDEPDESEDDFYARMDAARALCGT